MILWSHVCPGTYFKPTRFQGEISPHFGTDLDFTEIYKRAILISQCSVSFLKVACIYALLPLLPFKVILTQSYLGF